MNGAEPRLFCTHVGARSGGDPSGCASLLCQMHVHHPIQVCCSMWLWVADPLRPEPIVTTFPRGIVRDVSSPDTRSSATRPRKLTPEDECGVFPFPKPFTLSRPKTRSLRHLDRSRTTTATQPQLDPKDLLSTRVQVAARIRPLIANPEPS